MRRYLAVLICVSVLLAGVPAGAVAQSSSGEAYAGAHVSFDVEGSAVTDYQVHDEAVFSSVKVQSQSDAESGGLVGGDVSLSAMTSITGSALSVQSRTTTAVRIGTEGSASMSAHDNGHGILVVDAGEDAQYAVANLSAGASAEAESEGQIEVTTANGTKGTFIVVGEGNATVNDDGDVSAHLGSESRLVFRAYPDGKSETDEEGEAMIENGTATAEVHAMEQDGETVFDAVAYADGTAVTATERTESAVNVTVERATSTGTVVITSVSEEAVGAASDLEVRVDGEAAVRASSTSKLRSAIGSDSSKYVVATEGSASARADVLVAVNHFSERTVSMQDGSDGTTSDDGTTSEGTTTDSDADDSTKDGTTESDGSDDGATEADSDTTETETSGGTPGFGPLVAFAALAALALARRR